MEAGLQQPQQELRVTARDAAELFHRVYYDLGQMQAATWQKTYWMGIRVMKCPNDLFMYQGLIPRIKPRLIVETGTRAGGSALFLSHMLDLVGGDGRVITIDIEPTPRPVEHPRLTCLLGSSIDPQIIQQVRDASA